ncbi:hypothetical protein M407DRAFT_139568 [Tulasnella calospora MUT 4182]|uniref:Uncharacterized protein n=1 Tax=Tulasnella calospora MUT 4182 TaxID=1051891 RepID=A0A0C3Q8U0_9AGAM|nr:hypothetical protein M407DRAFT_139568 [Tulasnella calospora MUT 4182]
MIYKTNRIPHILVLPPSPYRDPTDSFRPLPYQHRCPEHLYKLNWFAPQLRHCRSSQGRELPAIVLKPSFAVASLSTRLT